MNKKTYNAKLKCIWVSPLDKHNFQEGKVYLVKNGKLIDGNGKRSYDTYSCLEDLQGAFYAEFQEI